MADGQRYLDHSADFLSSHSAAAQNTFTLNPFLADFVSKQPPSPPKLVDPTQRFRDFDQSMFSQGPQQGHNSRLNGAHGGQRLPMMYNYQQQQQQQQPHQHQAHGGPAGHQGMQSEHVGSHGSNGAVLGHHQSYSSGMLSNASPYNQNLQNGHSASASGSRAGQGQGQQYPEHWLEQLRMYKESQQANNSMVEQGAPNYFARLKASENRGIGGPTPTVGKATADGESEDRNRPLALEKQNKRQEWYNLDISGQGLRNLAPALFGYKFLQELYISSNKLSHLPPAVGELRALKVLEASYNQLTELPPELGMCTFLKHLLLFENNIRALPFELGSLHQLETLGIEGNPLNAEMKAEIVEKGTKSLITLLREQAPVPLPPAVRKNIVIQEDVAASLERIKVFSWNVLCDKYATQQTYGYTPTGALNWEYRKDCILEEIQLRDADFLCLQEISTEAFRDDFMPVLSRKDYKGVQFPKTRAKTMSERDAQAVDGCAVFYKGSKYILLDKQVVEFASIAINRPDMKGKADVFNRIMPKDNIAVICFFESRATGARLIMANLHLTWDAHFSDVKLVQTGIMMEFLTKVADKYQRWPALKDKKQLVFTSAGTDEDGQDIPAPPPVEPGPSKEYGDKTDIPLLICGDFNSTTDSSVYDLLNAGHVSERLSELSSHEYGNFSKQGIHHPFSLRDAYAPLHGTADELPFTNYTPGFADVIDYIWYSTNTLEVVSLLGPPDAEHLKRVPAFPNYHFPADHIQIMAEFLVKGRKEKKVIEPDFGSSSGGRNR